MEEVLPESIVDKIQEIHPDVIPEGIRCTRSEVTLSLKMQSCTFDGYKDHQL